MGEKRVPDIKIPLHVFMQILVMFEELDEKGDLSQEDLQYYKDTCLGPLKAKYDALVARKEYARYLKLKESDFQE